MGGWQVKLRVGWVALALTPLLVSCGGSGNSDVPLSNAQQACQLAAEVGATMRDPNTSVTDVDGIIEKVRSMAEYARAAKNGDTKSRFVLINQFAGDATAAADSMDGRAFSTALEGMRLSCQSVP